MTDPLDRIEAALSRLGAEHEPPPGWEARVLDAVDRKQRRRWWIYAAPGLALAAAAAFLIWFVVTPEDPGALALDVRAEQGAVVRGTSAQERAVGDIVHITVSGGRHRTLRVYRDEAHLVIGCPGDPACRVARDAIAVDLKLTQVGHYSIIALSSASPLPPMRGSFDADSAAATQAGADRKTHDINVR